MKIRIIFVIAIISVAVLAWWFAKPAATQPSVSTVATTSTATIATSTTNENLLPDVYPLYPGISWGSEEATTYEQFSGYQVTSAIQPNVTDLASLFQPFEEYYAKKLSDAGWSVDNALAAGGPGSEITAYKKGDDEIIVSYSSLFNMKSPNAPAQCPCEVTLKVFSGSSR